MLNDNSNKLILVTGSTDGIGKLTALKLAEQNGRVLIHGRDKDKTAKVVRELIERTGNKTVEGLTADLSSLTEVRQFADDVLNKYQKLNILINNAGAGYNDPRYSKDGYELRFAVNYLAPFMLTNLLLPALKKTSPSRIVNVSSVGQHPINFDDIMLEKKFDPVTAYSQSKLALIMFTFDLAEELKNDNITVTCLHPGTYLDTNMVRHAGINPLGKADTGADAVVFLAVSESLSGVTGKYFNVKTESKANAQAYDKEARKKLRELTHRLVSQYLYS